MRNDWEDIAVRILNAHTESLIELARIADSDPVEFFRGADLSGVPVALSEAIQLQLSDEQVDEIDLIDDQLPPEYETETLNILNELVFSGSFANTHTIVARIIPRKVFGVESIKMFLHAVQENRQVSWIIGDDDLVQLIHLMLVSPVVQVRRDLRSQLETLLQPDN